jgi:Do/DeqQ family serine protease
MEQKQRSFVYIGLVAFLAGIMFMGGCLLVGDLTGQQVPGVQGGNAGAEQIRPGVGSDTIANIVDSAGKAVVKISTVKISRSPDPLYDDPFFRYFFGQQMGPREQKQTGVGSGFIISEDGLVITNEHVISGATEIKVTIGGKEKEYNAKVVGADYDLDLAVIKIEGAQNLPHLKMGDSSKVKVGQWAIAIGNPFGFDHTVTVGVISAKGRPITVENRHYKNLLQTDAAINPGNSGGPLLNLNGEVIGINTAVAKAQGIGFAIPSNTVTGVLDELTNKGKVSHPWLGIQMSDLTEEIAQYFGLQGTDGVVIVGVIPGSPAEAAGLRQQDVVLELDGKKMKNTSQLAEAISNMEIGQKGALLIYRNGRVLNVTFTVGEKPAQLR